MNGLARSHATCELATIPLGTGMDFVRTHGIPTKFDDAVLCARDGVARAVDVGRVSYKTWSGEDAERYVANVGSVGMSAAVAQRANGMSKAAGGKATFFYALVRVFLDWENTIVSVELDDGERREGRMHDVIVANGQYHGGGMWLAPEASWDDGLFDVLLIGDITKRDFMTTAPKIYKGTHLSHPKVDLVRSRVVTVDAPERLPIELDGEQLGTTPIRFEVAPAAVRVRVPRRVVRVRVALEAAAYAALAILVAAGTLNGVDQWGVDHAMPGEHFHHAPVDVRRGDRAAAARDLQPGSARRRGDLDAAGVVRAVARPVRRRLARPLAARPAARRGRVGGGVDRGHGDRGADEGDADAAGAAHARTGCTSPASTPRIRAGTRSARCCSRRRSGSSGPPRASGPSRGRRSPSC